MPPAAAGPAKDTGSRPHRLQSRKPTRTSQREFRRRNLRPLRYGNWIGSFSPSSADPHGQARSSGRFSMIVISSPRSLVTF